jgi:hypothetical protein
MKMPVLYLLMFLTGDTKGNVTWNVASAFPNKAACEEALKEKGPEAVQKVPPQWTRVRYVPHY